MTEFEQRDNAERAIYYYGKCVDLWKDADPELQPTVDAAHRAIAALNLSPISAPPSG